MTFELYKASDWSFTENIEINTLEDLKKLAKKYDSKLIVDFRSEPSIIIYDDYIE